MRRKRARVSCRESQHGRRTVRVQAGIDVGDERRRGVDGRYASEAGCVTLLECLSGEALEPSLKEPRTIAGLGLFINQHVLGYYAWCKCITESALGYDSGRPRAVSPGVSVADKALVHPVPFVSCYLWLLLALAPVLLPVMCLLTPSHPTLI